MYERGVVKLFKFMQSDVCFRNGEPLKVLEYAKNLNDNFITATIESLP